MPRSSGDVERRHAAHRPVHDYPPTAQKIIRAARRIVVRDGYSRLTISNVERESGLNRGLIHYYFGGKAGLIGALIDLVFEDPEFGLSDEVLERPAGPERVVALLEWLSHIASNRDSGRLFYELLPRVLRSEALRLRASELYETYREFDSDCLCGGLDGCASDEERDALGVLSVAVVEGLALQHTVAPEPFDNEPAFRLWHEMLEAYRRSRSSRREPREPRRQSPSEE